MLARFSQNLAKNPAVWILLGLFLIAEYGNWQRGAELTRLCDLLGNPDGLARHQTAAYREIVKICQSRQPDDGD
jgi:hypothetical protein